MDTIIERDWKEQEKFGQFLKEFAENMHDCTKNMRGYVEEASGHLGASNAKDALELITRLLDDIDSSLPGVSEFGSKQLRRSQYLRQADEKTFKRL